MFLTSVFIPTWWILEVLSRAVPSCRTARFSVPELPPWKEGDTDDPPAPEASAAFHIPGWELQAARVECWPSLIVIAVKLAESIKAIVILIMVRGPFLTGAEQSIISKE